MSEVRDNIHHCCRCVSLQYGSGNVAACHIRFALRMSQLTRHPVMKIEVQ
jgi:hypothetical protein